NCEFENIRPGGARTEHRWVFFFPAVKEQCWQIRFKPKDQNLTAKGEIMNQRTQSELDQMILDHQKKSFSQRDVLALSQRYRREGFIIVPDVVPPELRAKTRKEALR